VQGGSGLSPSSPPSVLWAASPLLAWWAEPFGVPQDDLHECAALLGALLAALAALRLCQHGALFVALWALYLGCYHAGQTFYSFQWDILLLEVGFAAIVYAPWGLPFLASLPSPQPVAPTVWPLRWCLFKLMLMSGAVKIQALCPTWLRLTGEATPHLPIYEPAEVAPNAIKLTKLSVLCLRLRNSFGVPLCDAVYPHAVGMVVPATSASLPPLGRGVHLGRGAASAFPHPRAAGVGPAVGSAARRGAHGEEFRNFAFLTFSVACPCVSVMPAVAAYFATNSQACSSSTLVFVTFALFILLRW